MALRLLLWCEMKERLVMKKLQISLFILTASFLFGCAGGGENKPFEIQYEVTKEATCLEKGEEQGYDENGVLVTREIPALGHDYDSGTTVKEATCEDEGEKDYTCSRCNDKKVETLPALGHLGDGPYLYDNQKHYRECSRCNKHLDEGSHVFTFKGSTNLEPKYYFPENYYYLWDSLKPTFGYDENGKEIMGAVNEYSCPTCNASIYKAEFITGYTVDYSTNSSYIDTGYRSEFTYEYSDYRITGVSKKVIDNDNNASKTGLYFEYLYSDEGMTITRYDVSEDGNTKTPYLKAALVLDGKRITKINEYSYQSSNNTWRDSSWFEFTYDDQGKVAKLKQSSYFGSMWDETTYLVHDTYNEVFKPLKSVNYDEDGTALFTDEYTYDENEKIQSMIFTNHKTGRQSTRNYTYDSQGRLVSDGNYNYEYYDGDSYRYYLGTTLQKDVQVDSSGNITKETNYYDTLTTVYELLEKSASENESILSSKETYDYNEDSRDYVEKNYLKSTYANGLLKKTYQKKELEYSEQTYLNSNGVIETDTDYEYTSKKFRAKVTSETNGKYENEDRNDTKTSWVETYLFQEFPISKNIL